MFEEENETEVKKPSKNSKEVTMKYTGSFTVDGKTYNFEANVPFQVSQQKHFEAFEREIIRRGKLDGSITD